MQRHLSHFHIFVITILLAFSSLANGENLKQLKPVGYVNDYASVIDAESARQISFICEQARQKAKAQITVVTVHTLGGATIESYANNLFNQWGVGPKATNHGVMVLLAVEDRKYRIEVGRGLETVITDRKAAAFARAVVPLLKDRQYGKALLGMTRTIADAVATDAGVVIDSAPPPSTDSPAPSSATQSSTFASQESVTDWAKVAKIAGFIGFAIFVILLLVVMMSKSSGGTAVSGQPYYQPYYTYPGGQWMPGTQAAFVGFGGNSSSQHSSSWGGGGGFGGGSSFGGFGGGESSGAGSSADFGSSSGSSSSDSSSSSSDSGGGSSDGGGASDSY